MNIKGDLRGFPDLDDIPEDSALAEKDGREWMMRISCRSRRCS